MLFLKKYLLLFFLIENIIVQTSLLGSISEYFFYPILALGVICMFDKKIWQPATREKFKPLFLLMILYIFYEFIVGFEYISGKTLLYLVSKIITFFIIIISILYNERYYRTNAIFLLIVLSCGFLLYGLLTGGQSGHVTGRALAGYTNANTAGAMGALSIGMLLFYMRDKRWKWFPPGAILFIGFYGVLAGGSRAGFLMLFLLVFLRFGFNIKTFAIGGMLILCGLVILPAVGVKTVGLERLADTYTGKEKSNRDVERLAGEMMIAERPWIGWGYEAINQGEAAKISQLSAHNGFLEMTKQVGIPCAVIYFLIVLYPLFNYLRYWYKKRFHLDLFFALTIILLVTANYETLFIGVHEYITNIFFLSLAMVSTDTYHFKHKIIKK